MHGHSRCRVPEDITDTEDTAEHWIQDIEDTAEQWKLTTDKEDTAEQWTQQTQRIQQNGGHKPTDTEDVDTRDTEETAEQWTQLYHLNLLFSTEFY